MRAVAQADSGRRAAEFLDRHDVLKIAQARATIFLRDRDAVQAKIAHLGPQLAREAVGLVELGGNRRHFGRGKALNLVAQCVGGLAQTEVEGWHGIGDHDRDLPVAVWVNQGARFVSTLMRTNFHSASDGMKSSSKTTRAGSVGNDPFTISLPLPSITGAGS